MVAAYAEFANGGLQGRADPRRPRAGPLRRDHLPPRPARLRGLRRRRRRRRRASRWSTRTPSGSWTRSPPTRSPRCCRARSAAAPAPASVGQLGLNLAGKTGTTNEAKDVWYIGYSPRIVAGCYMGYDDPRAARRKRLRRHALRADLRRVHQGGDGGAGAGEVGGAAGRPLHQDRPPHRPAARPTTPSGANVQAEYIRDGQELMVGGYGQTVDGGWKMGADVPLFESVQQLAADRARAGPRPDPGAAVATRRSARCRAAGSTDAGALGARRIRQSAPDAVLGFWFRDDGHDRSLRRIGPRTWRMPRGRRRIAKGRFGELVARRGDGASSSTLGRERRAGAPRAVFALDQFPPVLRGRPAPSRRIPRPAGWRCRSRHVARRSRTSSETFGLIANAHSGGPITCLGWTASALAEADRRAPGPGQLRSARTRTASRDVSPAFGRQSHRNACSTVSTLGRRPASPAALPPRRSPAPRGLTGAASRPA